MAATATTADQVEIADVDGLLVWYRTEVDTEYGFCGRCGASLFWRSVGSPQHLSICAGSVDQPTGLVTDTALFTAEHGDYHDAQPVVHRYEGDRTG